MLRKCFFFLLLGLALFTQDARSEQRPNILFVFTDDHAPHAIGAYEGWLQSVNPTPNIDKLAKEGMLFRNSFCTNSICGPSRAVIQTGLHSHLNGFRDNREKFNGDQRTFPKLLQKAGYQTVMLGKWHLVTNPQGFDHWKVLPGQGAYYNPAFITPKGREVIEGYCTNIVTDLAIKWLKEERDPNKPFMMMCQHKAPHRTWMPPLEYLELYDDVDIPEPETLFDRWEDNASPARNQEMEIDGHLNIVFDCFGPPIHGWDPYAGKSVDRSGAKNLEQMTAAQLARWNEVFDRKNNELKKLNLTGKDLVRWKYHRYIRNYLRCVKGVDDSIAQLQKCLEENGLADNTIVIYSSDQGFYLGDHGWYDKRWMYEESLKMPFIVKWPGVVKPGSVNEDLIQNLDYAETFLDIAGVPVPEDMQGKSLVPLMKGNTPDDWRDSIYYHYYEYPSVHMVAKHRGIRTKTHKLIHFYEFGEWEFYDLVNDPDEKTNLYQDPKYADQISDMKKQLDELAAHYKDDTDVSEKPADWKAQFRPAS